MLGTNTNAIGTESKPDQCNEQLTKLGNKLKFKLKARNRILALALFTYAGASFGEAPTTQELQQQIEALKSSVESLEQKIRTEKTSAGTSSSSELANKDDISGLRADLENYKYDVQRLRDFKTVLANRGTTMTGTTQVRFNSTSAPATTGGASTQSTPRYSGFDVPLVNIAFAGNLFKDFGEGHNLDYKVGFGYAKVAGTTTSAAATSAFNLQDAYIQYNLINPAVTGLEDPTLNLRLGQQQTAFGLEAQTTDELKPAINAAQFVAGLGVGTRQIGLILRGDYDPYVDYGFNYRAPLLEYAIGVVNGSGPNQSDNNSRKDYLARLAVTAPVDYTSWLRELKFGVSVVHGTKNILAGTATTAVDGTSDRYGFDIYYNHLPFGGTYEYATGRDDTFVNNTALASSTSNIATTNTGKIGKIKSTGQTLTLFYTWGEQWLKSSNGTGQGKYDDWWPKTYQPFFRFDRWDPNTANTASTGTNVSARTDISTLGFNLFFAETTKFQINLNSYKFRNPGTPKYRDLIAQFQFGF